MVSGLPGKRNVRLDKKVKAILEEIKKAQADCEKQGLTFKGLTEEEIYQKLLRKNSPFIISEGWSQPCHPGGSMSYSLQIYNPDAIPQYGLFALAFVGPANLISDVSSALSVIDTRFARLIQPDWPGVSLPNPGAWQSLSFRIPIPVNVERTNYVVNGFLFQIHPDVFLDRGYAIIRVS